MRARLLHVKPPSSLLFWLLCVSVRVQRHWFSVRLIQRENTKAREAAQIPTPSVRVSVCPYRGLPVSQWFCSNRGVVRYPPKLNVHRCCCKMLWMKWLEMQSRVYACLSDAHAALHAFLSACHLMTRTTKNQFTCVNVKYVKVFLLHISLLSVWLHMLEVTANAAHSLCCKHKLLTFCCGWDMSKWQKGIWSRISISTHDQRVLPMDQFYLM